MNGKRKQYTNKFKAKVALEALKGDKTTAELLSMYGVHTSQIMKWKMNTQKKEEELQEQLWEIEDKITSIQVKNYNAKGLCDYLKDFVKTFNN